MSENIRILMADDHLVVREGLRAIFETAPDMEVVGEAENGMEAVRLAEELEPDVILMDLRMPVMSGIEAIEKILAAHSEAVIVILTTYDDDEHILGGLRAGARGYLLKDLDRKVLFDTVRAASRGEMLLPPSVADRVIAHLEAPRSSPTIALSGRELEVLTLMADGAANKQIAARLGITERTVKAHATSVFNKLGVNSRTEAVAVAIRRGMLAGTPDR